MYLLSVNVFKTLTTTKITTAAETTTSKTTKSSTKTKFISIKQIKMLLTTDRNNKVQNVFNEFTITVSSFIFQGEIFFPRKVNVRQLYHF